MTGEGTSWGQVLGFSEASSPWLSYPSTLPPSELPHRLLAQLSERKGVTLGKSHASLGPPNRVLVIKISKADVLRACPVPGTVPTFHTSVSTPTRWILHYFYPHLTYKKTSLEPRCVSLTFSQSMRAEPALVPSSHLPREHWGFGWRGEDQTREGTGERLGGRAEPEP